MAGRRHTQRRTTRRRPRAAGGSLLAGGLAGLLAAACAGPPPPTGTAACPAPTRRVADPLDAAAVAPGDARRGAQLFAKHCDACHAPRLAERAAGAPPQAPRLDCPDWLDATSDAALYGAINRGPGRMGHGPGMPPLGVALPPDAVADLVAHLRGLAARPEGDAPLSPPRAAPPEGSEPTPRR